MHFRKHKPTEQIVEVDKPHAEVVEIIINPNERTAYHETFMSNKNYCEYKGLQYSEPVGEAQHYPLKFTNWGRKLGMYFSQHTTQARFLDWFQFAKNVTYLIGFVHEEGKAAPLEFKVNNPDNFVDPSLEQDRDIKEHLDEFTTLEENMAIDWSKINYNISNNQTIPEMHEDVDDLLRGAPKTQWSPLLILAIVIISVAVCIVAGIYFLGNHDQTIQTVTNVTATVGPTIRGP